MSTGPTPIYLFNGMATTGVSDVADCSAFTRKSSVQIFITGTATVQLQGTLDPNNEVTWMDTHDPGERDIHPGLRLKSQLRYRNSDRVPWHRGR